jgi:hypothetical protein
MDDDTAKQVLVAVAAAAAAAAATLVARSDAALTAPCAASAVQWCVITITAHSLARCAVLSSQLTFPLLLSPTRYAAVRSLWRAAGQEHWASEGLADVLLHLRRVATNALVM